MKKLIITAATLLLTGAAAFAINQNSDPLVGENAEALKAGGPIIGPALTNWMDMKFTCTRVKKTVSIISISAGIITIGTGTEQITTETFEYQGCGHGPGWCLSSAGCP